VRRIDFSTAAILGSFIMLGIGVIVIASLSPAARKAGWRFFAASLFLIAAGSLTEAVYHPTLESAITWSYASVAFSVAGFALFLCGARVVLGTGSPLAWYLGVASTGVVAAAAFYFLLPGMLELRTLILSGGSILLFVPTIIRNRAYRSRIRHLGWFDAFLGASAAFALARLAFEYSLLGVERSRLVPVSNWLFVFFLAFSLAAIFVFALIVSGARHTGKPLLRDGTRPTLSLAERGLSASERRYVLAILDGASVKEIASDSAVATSTVRNTLARAYRKLGVADMVGLVSLSASMDIAE